MQNIEEIEKEILELENSIKGKKDNGIRGTMVKRYVKCGKEGCKCEFGQKHGPYPIIQLYDKDRDAKNIYITAKNEEEYRDKIEENKKFFAIIKKLSNLYLLKRKLVKKNEKSTLKEEKKEVELNNLKKCDSAEPVLTNTLGGINNDRECE